MNIQRLKFNLPYDLHLFHQGNIYWWMPLDRKLSVLDKESPTLDILELPKTVPNDI